MGKGNFLPFEEAREFVRSLGFKNSLEWGNYAKSVDRPKNIPSNPSKNYRNVGWRGMGDWLGTGYIASQKRVYRPFEDAVEFVNSLKLNSTQWKEYCKSGKKPDDIPAKPSDVYKNKGWKGMNHWLGKEIPSTYKHMFMPFEKALEFVRALNLRTMNDWQEYCKSGKKPIDIPLKPEKTYSKNGWKGYDHWLGYNRKKSKFLDFCEALKFVHSLNIKTSVEWYQYCKSGNKPINIPSTPSGVYKNKGWKNFRHWLGIENEPRLCFEKARSYVRGLGIVNHKEWRAYCISGKKPSYIPSSPESIYKDKGWIGWADWLGSGFISNFDKKKLFKPFEESRKFVHSLKLKSDSEWKSYCKSGNKPIDIPATPHAVYKYDGWKGIGDWLGTNTIATFNIEYRPFEKARSYVRSLGLKSQKEWKDYCRSGKKPNDIPYCVHTTYKNAGWISYGDWLGTKNISNRKIEYRSFEDARKFVQSLDLKNVNEWKKYCRTAQRPMDIPSGPNIIYKNSGWKNYSDWLGIFQIGETNRWNKSVTLQLLESLPLHSLTSAELLSIIKRSGALGRLNRSENFQRLLEAETANVKKSIAKKLLDEFRKMSDKEFDDSIDSEPSFTERTIEEGSDGSSENITTKDEADWFLETRKGFKETLDEISELDKEGSVFIDEEVAQFLVNNRVQILWNCHMNGDEAVFGQYESSEGRFMRMVREEFEKQKRSVENQKRPEGYAFRINGRIAEPSLMQKLTAHLLSEKKGLINCSGVGAGKSLAAIYASRLLQCRNTLLIAFNSTVDEWKSKIIEYFPDTEVYVKGRYENIVLDRNKWNVVVLNYESFQQHDSSQRLQGLVSNNLFDFVILDEVQFAKQSVEGGEEESGISLRRRNIDGTICTIRSSNPELYVLGMSATPVVTNLIEAKKLLEMVKGQEYVDLDTRPSIENALAVHVQLVNNGIRYRPAYDITVRERHLDVDARPLLREIVSVANGRVLSMENVLIDLKLNACREFITKGTMIYSHYTDEGRLLDRIKSFVEENGLSCGIYSGEDKSGKYDFISGRTDVLVGSSSVNTGLDGIQKVCNRIIILSLPWTHSQYEQLKGRIYRQGSSYSDIEVVIPFPEMEIGENRTWSWDRDRYNRVMERKTLADAALDGIIPDDRIRISESTLLSRCQKSLSEWIEEIKRGGQDKGFLRPSIMVALSSEETERVRKRYNPGDFTKFHQNWALEKSSTTHEKFKNDPSLWRYYHDMMDEHSSKWSEQPYRMISSNIRRSEWLIADLGCGQNRLRLELPMNKIEAFDHVAIDDSVIECDISRLPVEDERYDAVVMSLSLMGRNQLDYLKEAYRVLKHKQWLYVAEPKGKWNGNGEELVQILRDVGFGCQGFRMTEDFIYVEGWKN